MYTYVYMCAYIYMCVYMCIYVFVYVYVFICICICIHMYVLNPHSCPLFFKKKKKQQRVTIEGASFGLALRSVAVIFPPLRKLNLMPKPYA